METGETPEEALKREIQEELATDIGVEDLIETIEWDYPKFHLTMHCYWCHVEKGSLSLQEHEAAKWLGKDELLSVKWLPADIQLIDKIRDRLSETDSGYRQRAPVASCAIPRQEETVVQI